MQENAIKSGFFDELADLERAAIGFYVNYSILAFLRGFCGYSKRSIKKAPLCKGAS